MINKYNTLIDEDSLPKLVKEQAVQYGNEDDCYSGPDNVANMLNTVFKHGLQTEEIVYMLCLDTANHLIGVFEISHGNTCTSLIDPSVIFKKALLCGSNRIIIAHNHPSGCLTPSKEDDAACKRLKECGELMNIGLLDFIIVCRRAYLSYRSSDLL